MQYSTEKHYIPDDIPIPYTEFQPLNCVECDIAEKVAKECIEIKVDKNWIVNEFYLKLMNNNICESKLTSLAVIYLLPHFEN